MSCGERFHPEAPGVPICPLPQGSPWDTAVTGLSTFLSGMEGGGLAADLPLVNPLVCHESFPIPYVMQSKEQKH